MSAVMVGVLSDTHLAGGAVPGAVMDALAECDLILHAGDILDLEVLEQLSTIAETLAVRGNMDRGEAAESLPARRVVEVGGFRIGLTHGGGPPQEIVQRVAGEFDDVDCIVFGHTHAPMCGVRDGVLFFNPGSPTDRVFAKSNTVGLLLVADIISPRIVEV